MKNFTLFVLAIFFTNYTFSQEENKDSVEIQKMLNEVVVTGQIKKTIKKEAVYDFTLINSETINSGSFQNLSDILKYQNNINFNNDNILGGSIKFQGISGENVKILIDGIPIIGRLNGNIDVSQINLNNIEKIEIVEGPLSVNFGSDALAGTINIITKKEFEKKYTLNINSYYESVGKYDNNIFANYKFKNHNISNQLTRNYFSGWSEGDQFTFFPEKAVADSNRFKEWKPKEQFENKLQHNVKFKNIKIRNYLEYFSEKITNRGMPRGPYLDYAFDDYYYTYRTNIGSDINIIRRDYSINSLIAYNKYKRRKNTYRKELTTLDQNLTNNVGDQDTTHLSMFMFKTFYNNKKNNLINYQIGIDLINESAKSKRITGESQYQTDIGLFSNAEIILAKKIKLRPGIRLIYNNRYNAPIIASFNLLYDIKEFDLQCRASYAKGFRSPSLKELFFEFVDVNHNIVGNSELEAEKGDVYRFTLNKHIERKIKQDYKLSFFYNNINNKISLTSTDNTYSYFNINKYKTIGSSLNISIFENEHQLNIGGSYIGISNEIEGESIPTFNYSLDLNTNLKIKIHSSITLNLFYKFNGPKVNFIADEDDEITETIIDSYHMLDISINKILLRNKLSFDFGTKNLMDVKNINVVSNNIHNSNNSMFIGYGRTIFASLKFEL